MRSTLALVALVALIGCARPGEKAAASLGGLMRGRVRTVTIVGREEKELNRLVRARRPKLVNLQIGLRGSFVSVRVTPEIFGYPTVPIQVEGSLLPRGGGVTMDFESDKARLLIIPIPKPVLDYVAEQINPVVDFSALRAPIRVEKAEVRGGSLLLSGYLPPEQVNGLGVQRGNR